MELLRIVSMMMVLAVHIDGASLGFPRLEGNVGAATGRDVWILLWESFTIIGVNCFTLISGYFGINLKWKSVGKYLFECIFYSVGIFTLMCFYRPELFSWGKWWESWLVLTHTDLWYVPAYFILMLLAPFINAGFSHLSQRQAYVLTGAFLAYNLWAGWWWDGGFNPTGYTPVQLILMYMIGRCVAMAMKDVIKNRGIRLNILVFSMGLYLIFTVITFFYSCLNPLKAYAYNSPFVIGSSVAFFMIFLSMDSRSRFVNYAAKSAFAVYLIHKAPPVWGGVLKPTVVAMWQSTSLGTFTLYALILIIVIYAICMLIDIFRRKISSLLFR